jgi:hypothetical protein
MGGGCRTVCFGRGHSRPHPHRCVPPVAVDSVLALAVLGQNGELLAVTVYRKGAIAIAQKLAG